MKKSAPKIDSKINAKIEVRKVIKINLLVILILSQNPFFFTE